MKIVKVLAFVGLAAAAILGVLALFVPLPPSPGNTELANRITVVVSAVYLVLSVDTVFLFLSGLGGFKKELRRAYIILSAGIMMFALAQVQVPVTTITGWRWWTTSGLVALPYVTSSALVFWGTRTFAQLLGMRDAFTKFRYVLPANIVLLTALALLIPARLSTIMPTVVTHHVFTGITVWMLVFDGVAAYNIWRIRRAMSNAYGKAMLWLFIASFSYGLTHFHFLILQFTGYDNWYGLNAIETIPLMLVGILLVKAGYEFWKVTAPQEAAKSSSPLEVVVYVAGLATNRNEIYSIMDKVRVISANLATGGTLSEQNQVALAQVYLKLEEYLVSQEKLRVFTREGLRRDIGRTFPHNEGQNTAFWSKLA